MRGSSASHAVERPVREHARRLHLHGHVGEHELDPLEVHDPLAELPPLAPVGERQVQRSLRDADGLGRDHRSRMIERPHRDREPLAFLADHPVRGDPAPVQDHLARRRALDAHLLLRLAERHAGVVAHHQERRDAFGAERRISGRENQIRVRYSGPRDETLGSVQHELTAVALVPRGHRSRVGARPGLGERVRHQDVAATDALRHRSSLLVGAGQHERDDAELRDDGCERHAGGDPGQLLDEDTERERTAARAAVGLRVADAHQLVLDEHLIDILGPFVGLVDLGGARRDLLLGDLPDEGTELLQFLRQLVASIVHD